MENSGKSGIVRGLIILDMRFFSGLLLWEDPVIPITGISWTEGRRLGTVSRYLEAVIDEPLESS